MESQEVQISAPTVRIACVQLMHTRGEKSQEKKDLHLGGQIAA